MFGHIFFLLIGVTAIKKAGPEASLSSTKLENQLHFLLAGVGTYMAFLAVCIHMVVFGAGLGAYMLFQLSIFFRSVFLVRLCLSRYQQADHGGHQHYFFHLIDLLVK
jgi:hypothetical protein